MRYINNSSYKSLSFGKFTGNWHFSVSNGVCGWDVEAKGFGKHLRWYPGQRFFFIRGLV